MTHHDKHGQAARPADAPVPTTPVITGVITGPHTIRLDAGMVAVVGERIQPETPGYGSSVPVLTVDGDVITTGETFLPLNTHTSEVTFKVVSVP